ncbi:MAG: trimeric intracellular cation channel family protein [Planctomycetes bacterium]|nr:trimeric intracellular cation channel family protein [Planctomycetota bacterium]
MRPEIYFLDLLGTFTFAAYGAYVAQKKQFDIFGIFTCAFLTALGGGTIRELILGNMLFYFSDYNYLYAIILATIFSIFIYKKFNKIHRYMLVVDAVGLTTFALIGATKAAQADLGAFAIIFLATVTAVAGGLLRDISIREVPQILYRDFYASPAIFLGVMYSIFSSYMEKSLCVYALITCTFLLRLLAIHFKIDLWGPRRKNAQ